MNITQKIPHISLFHAFLAIFNKNANKFANHVHAISSTIQILYDSTDKVVGIATNDMGVAKDGSRKDNFQSGVELKGKSCVLCSSSSHGRGSLFTGPILWSVDIELFTKIIKNFSYNAWRDLHFLLPLSKFNNDRLES